jgi:hypothetical protein
MFERRRALLDGSSSRVRALLSAVLAVLVASCGPGSPQFIFGESGPAGSWASVLLGDRAYTRLVVTVDYVPGQEPSPEALALLQLRLSERCRKPDGVLVERGRAISPLPGGVYGPPEISALAAANRTVHSDGGTVSVYVLYLDGRSSLTVDLSEEILGNAVEATCFAVFKRAIWNEASAIGTSPLQVEATTLVHEMGHLLGLVGFGSSEQGPHEDLAHRHHCSSPVCAMSWILTSRSTGDGTGLETIDFDAACIADLQANGGR